MSSGELFVRLPAQQQEMARRILETPQLQDLVQAFTPPPTAFLEGRARQARQQLAGRKGGDGQAARDAQQISRVLKAWRALDAPSDPAVGKYQPIYEASALWDFRLGEERDSIPSRASLLPALIGRKIEALAEVWGMRSAGDPAEWSAGRSGPYQVDVVILPGGLVSSNWLRPKRLAQLMLGQHPTIQAHRVFGISGERVITSREAQLMKRLGLGGMTEGMLLRAGMQRYLGSEGAGWQYERRNMLRLDCGLSEVYHYEVPRNPYTGRRPGGSESFGRFIVNRRREFQGGNRPGTGPLRVLCVTTNIYRPLMHLQLLSRLARLDNDLQIELVTVGFDSQEMRADGDPVADALLQRFQPQHYLMEFKATIDQARYILGAADGAHRQDASEVIAPGLLTGRASLFDRARVVGGAVSGSACVRARAVVADEAQVGENADVSGYAYIAGRAIVRGNASIGGDVRMTNFRPSGIGPVVGGNARLDGVVEVADEVTIQGDTEIWGSDQEGPGSGVIIMGQVHVDDNARIYGHVELIGDAVVSGYAVVAGSKEAAARLGDGARVELPHHVQTLRIEPVEGIVECYTVYRAWDPVSERYVARTVPDPGPARSSWTEAHQAQHRLMEELVVA